MGIGTMFTANKEEKTMKKLMALILCMIMAVLVTGCGSGGSGSDYKDMVDKGELVVGITDYAPMDYQDDNAVLWKLDRKDCLLFIRY